MNIRNQIRTDDHLFESRSRRPEVSRPLQSGRLEFVGGTLVPPSKRFVWTFLLLHAGSLCIGCGSKATVESFHPEDLTAQQALEKALTAWKNGQEQPGLVAGTSAPEIRVADERWLKGAKLKSFEIGEPLDEDGPAKFPVKLTLDGAAAPEEETYMVVGKDPLGSATRSQRRSQLPACRLCVCPFFHIESRKHERTKTRNRTEIVGGKV